MTRDYLPIVEAAHSAACSEAAWLEALAHATRKTLDQGLGAYAVRYACRRTINVSLTAKAGIPSALWRGMATTRTLFTPSQASRVYNSVIPVAMLSAVLRGDDLTPRIWEDYLHAHGVGDFLMIRAGEGLRPGI